MYAAFPHVDIGYDRKIGDTRLVERMRLARCFELHVAQRASHCKDSSCSRNHHLESRERDPSVNRQDIHGIRRHRCHGTQQGANHQTLGILHRLAALDQERDHLHNRRTHWYCIASSRQIVNSLPFFWVGRRMVYVEVKETLVLANNACAAVAKTRRHNKFLLDKTRRQTSSLSGCMF